MKRLLVMFVFVLCALGTYAQRGNIPNPRARGITDGFDVLTVTLDYAYDDVIGELVFSGATIRGVDGEVVAGEFVVHDQENYRVPSDGLSPSFKAFAGRVHTEAFNNYKARKGY